MGTTAQDQEPQSAADLSAFKELGKSLLKLAITPSANSNKKMEAFEGRGHDLGPGRARPGERGAWTTDKKENKALRLWRKMRCKIISWV